ncbi:MAG: GNAT family N-acetyltransferase [Gemmatimonadota bacterium]
MTAHRNDIRVVPVRSRTERRAFLRLPYRIYRRDRNWVAPLLHDMRVMLDPERHPFHRHSEVQPFLAVEGGRPVGRISAIHNRRHVEFHREPVGFYGFFECVDDQAVADALFDAAGAWLGERGLETMRGPTSFSTNEQAGLLIEGFDRPPVIMMPYNPPYYPVLTEGAGFGTAKTLVAYVHADQRPPERLLRAEKRLGRRYGVRLRGLRMDRFEEELDHIRRIYNAAWEKNWGFVPMTDAEIAFMAKELKPLVKKDPDLVMMAENVAGEPIGFALCLRDYNVALAPARGKLFPFGVFKILWKVARAKRIHGARVLTLGLLPEYRGRGIDSLLYLRIFRKGTAAGITEAEFSWVLEDNEPMRRPLERIGARVYKRYRVYDRAL